MRGLALHTRCDSLSPDDPRTSDPTSCAPIARVRPPGSRTPRSAPMRLEDRLPSRAFGSGALNPGVPASGRAYRPLRTPSRWLGETAQNARRERRSAPYRASGEPSRCSRTARSGSTCTAQPARRAGGGPGTRLKLGLPNPQAPPVPSPAATGHSLRSDRALVTNLSLRLAPPGANACLLEQTSRPGQCR